MTFLPRSQNRKRVERQIPQHPENNHYTKNNPGCAFEVKNIGEFPPEEPV